MPFPFPRLIRAVARRISLQTWKVSQPKQEGKKWKAAGQSGSANEPARSSIAAWPPNGNCRGRAWQPEARRPLDRKATVPIALECSKQASNPWPQCDLGRRGYGENPRCRRLGRELAGWSEPSPSPISLVPRRMNRGEGERQGRRGFGQAVVCQLAAVWMCKVQVVVGPRTQEGRNGDRSVAACCLG